MLRESAIKVEGRVVEVLPNTLCRVELANGHRVLAYRSARLRASLAGLVPGDRVTVEMSLFDLSKGCITVREQKIL